MENSLPSEIAGESRFFYAAMQQFLEILLLVVCMSAVIFGTVLMISFVSAMYG